MQELDLLRRYLQDSDNLVFLGGAGVSTESGIPDFRSADGIYDSISHYGYAPEVMLSRSFFEEHPQLFYDFYFQQLVYADAQPNSAHLVLAQMEREQRLRAVITQNIDGLHQKAGSSQVLELHGSLLNNYCLNCGLRYDLQFMLAEQPRIPLCLDCGSIVRPDIVLYEEELPPKTTALAKRHITQADTLLVGGTSLSVYPAAGLIDFFRGKRLILINKTATNYDKAADLLIRHSIGEALAYALIKS